MAEYKFYLRQPPASELVDKLLSVVEEVSPNCQVTGFYLQTNSGIFNFIGGGAAQNISAFRNRNAPEGILHSLTSRPWLDVINFSLNTNADYSFTIRTDKGFYIALNTSGSRENNFSAISPISDALNSRFNLFRQQQALESALPEAERQATETARTLILDFAGQAARLSEMSASNTERMNDIILKKTEELESRYENKNKELEESHRTKIEELEGLEESFRKEKARFDARENTVVRRDLLSKIEKILGDQRQINITTSTTQKRGPIHIISAIALIVAVCLICAFGFKTFSDTTPDLHHLLPLSTGILLFVSTAIFYIRWTDLWFKEHANAEFENRKFYIDVVRASWIAELLFEWKEKKEVPFPDQLITSYTTGLFQSNDLVKTARHPLDDLKSLAGSVSEIRFSQKDGISFKKKAEAER